MPLDTLANTLTHELSDLQSAELQFGKALQQVAKNADSAELRELVLAHHAETQQQIENLKQAFASLGTKAERGVVCKGAKGIVEENNSTLKEEKPKGILKDIALVSGGLRMEHYEIAGYSAAIALAKSVGNRTVVQLLQANLKQEQEAVRKLQAAATQFIAAANASGDSAEAPAPAKRGRKPGTAKAAAPAAKEPAKRGRKPGPKPAAAAAPAKSGRGRRPAAAAASAPVAKAPAKRGPAPKAAATAAAPAKRGRKPGPKPAASAAPARATRSVKAAPVAAPKAATGKKRGRKPKAK